MKREWIPFIYLFWGPTNLSGIKLLMNFLYQMVLIGGLILLVIKVVGA